MTTRYRKKLIEVAIPLAAINAASEHEKHIRHGHPSTFHLWWARRPLAACRAILFAQLVDDPSEHIDELKENSKKRQAAEDELANRLAKSRNGGGEISQAVQADGKLTTLEDVIVELERERLFKIIEELVIWKNSMNEKVLGHARAEIRRCCNGKLPAIYDPFSGGGSIPLEAQRLGLPAIGSDLNPVAVLIGKAMIEIPPKFKDRPPVHLGSKDKLLYRGAEGLAEDIMFHARELREKAWSKIGHLYPRVRLPKQDGGGEETVLAWLWARTIASPNPAVGGVQIPLVSTFWLCNKPRKKVWVKPLVEGKDIRFTINYGEPEDVNAVAAGTKMGRGANFTCLLTGDAVPAEYVKAEGMAGRMGWKLLAIVAEGREGRRYAEATREHEQVAFSEEPNWRPEYPLSQHPQNMSVTNYGPTKISDLFMDRQTIALNTLLQCIPAVVAHIDKPVEYRRAIATYLAICVSRLANRQSTSTFWDKGAEKIQQVFAMQALPMRWDTAEGNPFSTSSGNFMGQVEYLTKVVAALPARQIPGREEQRDAQAVDFRDYVISTDPPYYDNVPYADLSDFFYVWLRRALLDHYPDLFETVLVPKGDELVADHQRHKGRDQADEFFLAGMSNVMSHMADQSRIDIPTAIYYAFRQGEVDEGGTSSKGWATFLQSVISAGYRVDATWPVRTELVGNLKKKRNALATSVVLSCRRRPDSAEIVTRSEFMRSPQA